MSRDILICTVGTSLFGNIEKLDKEDPTKVSKNKGNFVGLVKELIKKKPDDRLCGAEINSITSLINKNKLSAREELHFMVSDTNDGKDIGEILKSYYEDSKNPYKFNRVVIHSVSGLRDDDVKSFRNHGLRNLVREIAKLVREKGSQRIVINATGGYKAQISLAGLIGQALEIPVMYMFERFDEIIELPPQPLSFSFDIWLKNYESFDYLAYEPLVSYEEVRVLIQDDRLKPLLDEERIDGKTMVALSPVGQLFHEGFLYKFQKEKRNLLPQELPDSEREEPRLSEHFYHNPPLFAEDFVKRLWREKKYIRTIKDFYTNPDLPERNKFIFDKAHNKVVLIYSDGSKTAKFNIEIPTTNELMLKAAVADLSDSLSK